MQQCGKADFALKEWLAEQFKSALECHCPVHCLQFQDQVHCSAQWIEVPSEFQWIVVPIVASEVQ